MDLIYKIALKENIMSLRHMFVNLTDQHSTVITPRLLFHPFITSEAVTLGSIDMSHHIFTEVLSNNHLILEWVKTRHCLLPANQCSEIQLQEGTWKAIKVIPYTNDRGHGNVQRQRGEKDLWCHHRNPEEKSNDGQMYQTQDCRRNCKASKSVYSSL